MNKDDRKKYLEELMQPHIPLRVLQEIRDEMNILDDKGEFNILGALAIIDKHIKEYAE